VPCQHLLAALAAVPTAAGIQPLVQFRSNFATGYGNDIATSPARMAFANSDAATTKESPFQMTPGLSYLNYTLVIYDGRGNLVRGIADLVVRMRACPSPAAVKAVVCEDNAQALLPVAFYAVEFTTGLCHIEGQEFLHCAVSAPAVQVQFSLAGDNQVVPLVQQIGCVACGPGQARYLEPSPTGLIAWECQVCSSGQYVLNSSESVDGCQDCPVGAICSGGLFVGSVVGSVWVEDNKTGQYLLVSCPPGYELINEDTDTGAFSAIAQECRLCPTSFYCTGGDTAPQQCPPSTFAPSGSNGSDACTLAYIVQVAVERNPDFNSVIFSSYIYVIRG
jgi:hypothetical protein